MYQLRQPLYIFSGDMLAGLLACAHRCNPQPGPGGSGMTDLTETRRIFWDHAGLVTLFPGEWYNCRVVGLWPSQQIPLHQDSAIIGVRHHIPLQINDDCWVYSDGTWQRVAVGVVYTMDPTKPHGAVNWGETIRLHLMIDIDPVGAPQA